MIELGGERQLRVIKVFQAQVAPFRLSPGHQHIRGVVRYLKADLRRASLRIVARDVICDPVTVGQTRTTGSIVILSENYLN